MFTFKTDKLSVKISCVYDEDKLSYRCKVVVFFKKAKQL